MQVGVSCAERFGLGVLNSTIVSIRGREPLFYQGLHSIGRRLLCSDVIDYGGQGYYTWRILGGAESKCVCSFLSGPHISVPFLLFLPIAKDLAPAD